MESVESPLEVLSRAATMMQHRHAYPASDSDSFGSPSTASGGESEREGALSPETAPPATAAPSAAPAAAAPARPKQLPSAKWRRERRSTRLPDYKPRESGNKALRSQSFNERRGGGGGGAVSRGAAHSDGESPDDEPPARAPRATDAAHSGARPLAARGAPPDYPSEAPIDMRLKCRPTPPPPYPLAAAPVAPAAHRATVITHAPHDAPGTGSMSMCDPVIDEHFRRSLGDDYMTLFTKRAPEAKKTKDRGSSPIRFPSDPCANFLPQDKSCPEPKPAEKTPEDVKPVVKKTETVLCEDVAMEIDSAASSVDDHFAKALGDTWRKIQISRLEAERPGKKDKRTRPGVVI